MKVVVAQKGAREHYLAAVALARAGKLAALFTDWYAPQSWISEQVLAACGHSGKRMLAAKADDLSHKDVIALRWQTLFDRLSMKFFRHAKGIYENYLWAGSRFARQAAAANLPAHDVLFIYSYAALEAMQAARSREVLIVLDQIDPGPVEFRIVAEEAKAWPLYAETLESFPTDYFERLRKEWREADVIVVNSEWSRAALIAEGATPEKINVLPLAYELKREKQIGVSTRKGCTRVLWLGQVNIRKGIQYLVEAARLLEGEDVEFIVVGPIQIRQEAIIAAPANIQWLGSVTRDEVGKLYESSDLFVLPTISDGFAITQLEAMANGLPVIATTNCGQVVVDGENGFLIPPRNAEALAEAILKFIDDPHLSSDMKPSCFKRAKAFSVEAYGKRLVEIIERGMKVKNRRNA